MPRYQVFPYAIVQGQPSIPDEVMANVWKQMVDEDKAKKVFYNGYITTVYDFINFMKTGGILPILIVDNDSRAICHIAWISDYGDGHACLHHCSLGTFRRGAAKAILEYYGQFKTNDGTPTFETMIGITPENNKAAVRVAKIMGFKLLTPSVPMLCNDVYAGEKVNGVISFYQYERGTPLASHAEKGEKPWAAAEKAAAGQALQL